MNKSSLPKRFYTSVTMARAVGGFSIELDGRSIKSPGKKLTVTLPTKALAMAVAAEWAAQKEVIDIQAMPLSRLAQGAAEFDTADRQRLIDDVINYSKSDLLCYRSSDPQPLVMRQHEVWQPLLDWAGEALGVHLDHTAGFTVCDQPEASIAAVGEYASKLSLYELAGLAPAVALLGSTVLALALHQGRISPEEALAASLLDELWQVEMWGEDDEAAHRRVGLGRDVANLKRFMDCLGEAQDNL